MDLLTTFPCPPYKRAYIAALQCLLRHRHNPRAAAIHKMDRGLQLVDCGSYLQKLLKQSMICSCGSLPEWVDFSLPQRRNISPFIPSPLLLLQWHSKVQTKTEWYSSSCAKIKLQQHNTYCILCLIVWTKNMVCKSNVKIFCLITCMLCYGGFKSRWGMVY